MSRSPVSEPLRRARPAPADPPATRGRPMRTAVRLLVLLLLAACARPSPEEDAAIPAEPPYIVGTVTAASPGEVRIEEDPASEAGSAKAVLRITGRTRLLRRSGGAAPAGDLAPGARVSAWVTGPIAESYPVQAEAATIVVEETG